MNRTTAQIGRRLTEIRGDRTQMDFSKQTNIPQSTLSAMERGVMAHTVLYFRRLAEKEDVDLNWLITGTAAPTNGK